MVSQAFHVPNFLLASLLSTKRTNRLHSNTLVTVFVKIEHFDATVTRKLHLVKELQGMRVQFFLMILNINYVTAGTLFI